MTTVRDLIGTAVMKGWDMYQLDVNNVFFHGYLHEKVYMQVPQGLIVNRSNLVCKLNKSLYGKAGKQAVGNSMVFVAVYVDYVILTGTDTEEILSLKRFLDNTFRIKDLGKLHYFLVMKVLCTTDGVLLTQRKFAQDLLKEHHYLSCSPMSSPLDSSIKLRADDGVMLDDPSHYRKLIGKLNFLTNTRLDIAYSVQHLIQYMQSPRDTRLKASTHVLKYLKGNPSLGLFFPSTKDYTVKAFCDSDWAACPEFRRSVSDFVIMLGSTPIN
uniref:Uncharacterized mitochondrial protein AtMg00810-like n=1 Tax=Nicotiana tabacum TaxID=4097 RepID=A0A1S4AFC3_TOBAC|nr:PREDICTED: uncharacterized mitochondrial protein AtMg00810-like [Nicotiana tabacum]